MEHPNDPHHPDIHPAGVAHAAPEEPFSEEEIKMLHSQDMSAATYVVGLMLAIFTIGVVLYTIIAFITAA